MYGKAKYYTPSLAKANDGIWCIFKEVSEGPRNRIWLARIEEEGVNPVCSLLDTRNLLGDCEPIRRSGT